MYRWSAIAGITLAVAASAHAAAALPPKGPPFAFGGTGPYGAYTVVIKADGSVQASGNGGLTRVGAPHLGPAQLASLNRSVTHSGFGGMLAATHCPQGTSGSATWIRVGSKTVTVEGTCRLAYQRLFKALVATTRFFMSS
jgi:hypothetical protein